jgi:hypothetical protein
MILIITNSEDKTVDYLLKSVSKNHFRFNTDNFLIDYDFDFSQKWYIRNKKDNLLINDNRLSGIYYRRPVLPLVDVQNINDDLLRQLQNEAYDIYDSFINSIDTKYLNNKYDIIKAENKLIQLKVAKTIGFSTPKTIITNDKNALTEFIKQDRKYCIKPLYLGFFELHGNNFIPYTAIIKNSDYDLITNYPVLVQEYVEKKYEIRLTCVGDKIFPVKILSQVNDNTKIDWRIENCAAVEYEKMNINCDINNRCLKLLDCFNLNFACIDLIVGKNNKIYFLDLNPNGQWAWLDEILKLGIAEEIERYFYERK